MITASGVTLDLAGFTISGRTNVPPSIESTAILGSGDLRGIAVLNGSVSGFQIGANLGSATGSLVEKLRVFDITPILPRDRFINPIDDRPHRARSYRSSILSVAMRKHSC
jgi:hypothetical protein